MSVVVASNIYDPSKPIPLRRTISMPYFKTKDEFADFLQQVDFVEHVMRYEHDTKWMIWINIDTHFEDETKEEPDYRMRHISICGKVDKSNPWKEEEIRPYITQGFINQYPTIQTIEKCAGYLSNDKHQLLYPYRITFSD